MKRPSLTIAIALLLGAALTSCSTFEVNKSVRLTYDMAHDNFYTSPPGAGSVNEGDMVSLELVNVNPFLYNVTINDKAVSHSASVPPMIKLPATPVAQLTESVPATLVTDQDAAGRVNVAAVSRFGDIYSDFRRQYTIFHGFLSYDDYLYSALRRPFVDEKAFKEDLQTRLLDAAGGTKLYTRTDFLNKGEEFFANLNTAYTKLTTEYQLLDAPSKAEVKDLYANAMRAYTDLARSPWPAKLGNTADLFTTVQNTPFTFSSFKSQAEGSVVRFLVDGQRKSQSDLMGTENVKPFDLEYKVKINGTWAIDFSAGLFMSNLVNESYAIKEDPTQRTILKKTGDILNYGPGALMHFYYQPFGLGIGLGMYANNSGNVQYLFGPSLLLGKGNRFCVSGGVTVGKVTRLADGLTVGGPLVSQDNTLSTVPTNDRLDYAFYGGFSYNFSSGW